MLMPFGSAYTVHNLGIDIVHLPTIYLVSGLFSIFMGPLVGKASDAFGKFPTFVFRQRGVGRDGADLHPSWSRFIDDSDRRQRSDVRRHLVAHDSVTGPDLGDPRTQSTRLLQRRQRFRAAVLRRARFRPRRRDHRPECERFAAAFRLGGLCRRRNDDDVAVAMYFVQKSVAKQTGDRTVLPARSKGGTLHLSNTSSENGIIRHFAIACPHH